MPNIMVAEITIAGASVKPGVPRALFPLMGNPNFPHVTAYHRYAVTSDGQRFLFPQPAGAPTGAGGLAGTLANNADQNAGGNLSTVGAVNVILNWPRAIQK